MAEDLLPDALWTEIEPLLPPPPPRTRKGGRPPVDNRAALRGIIFVNRTGIPWQALPTEAFGVSGSSCWRRFSEWTGAGIWPDADKACTATIRVTDRVTPNPHTVQTYQSLHDYYQSLYPALKPTFHALSN